MAMQNKFREAVYHEQRLACSIGNFRYQEEWLARSCTSLSIGPLMVEWWASVKNGEMHIWATLASEEPKGEEVKWVASHRSMRSETSES